jgi:DNA invertase Pin-like site-specific DNA recombinase
VVYVRQSSVRQIVEHQESTARQYALKDRAVQLGWDASCVDVIDEDLGDSGSSASWRSGFSRLAEQVAHGRVGVILALEVSRLARSCADWHRLVELCALADVAIADEGTVYAPSDHNDRLLLGIKATMSEAEQYWMRLRLQGGRIHKARRGAYHVSPPVGYEWDAQRQGYVMDADEQVRSAVKLVFERFLIDGSAYRVHQYMLEHGLQLPARDLATRTLSWTHPRHGKILRMLHHPFYAGAYVYGRNQERIGLQNGVIHKRVKQKLPQPQWQVCLKDQHPAYISWEEFMANQDTLSDNRTSRKPVDRHGAARVGGALLQGLALCGRCGRRMRLHYKGNGHMPIYECRPTTDRSKVCYFVHADEVDSAVTNLVLETINPTEIDLSLAVSHQVQRQASDLDRQWQLRRERARYEARLAERRYKAVDPDNRVVARTLERDWNTKLIELHNTEHGYEQIREHKKLQLDQTDIQRIRALAGDLRAVFFAATTTPQDRKRLLRMVIADVSLTPVDVPQAQTRIQVLWHSGATSVLTVPRPNRIAKRQAPAEAIAIIEQCSRAHIQDRDIAKQLNDAGFTTGQNRSWNIATVRRIRTTRLPHMDLPRRRNIPNRRHDGLYSLKGVADLLGISPRVVDYWVRAGKLASDQGGGPGRPRWFRIDEATLEYLNHLKSRPKHDVPSFHSAAMESEWGHYA